MHGFTNQHFRRDGLNGICKVFSILATTETISRINPGREQAYSWIIAALFRDNSETYQSRSEYIRNVPYLFTIYCLFIASRRDKGDKEVDNSDWKDIGGSGGDERWVFKRTTAIPCEAMPELGVWQN